MLTVYRFFFLFLFFIQQLNLANFQKIKLHVILCLFAWVSFFCSFVNYQLLFICPFDIEKFFYWEIQEHVFNCKQTNQKVCVCVGGVIHKIHCWLKDCQVIFYCRKNIHQFFDVSLLPLFVYPSFCLWIVRNFLYSV